MNYNKTIDPADYEMSDLFQHIDNMRGVLEGTYTGWQTEWRKWEYSKTLMALRENGAKTVLDVGGGSSLFAAAAIWAGFEVTVVDPDDYRDMFHKQSQRIGKPIQFVHQDFFDYPEGEQYDAVTCISVIEHVPDYEPFFAKLLRHVKVGGLLCLTTDYHPDCIAPLYPSHLRTYNSAMLTGLRSMAEFGSNGNFEVYGDKPDYSSFQPIVHGLYSFASLVLKRTR